MLPETGVLQTWSDALLSIALYLQSTSEHALTCEQEMAKSEVNP
jgi:hypothetical protein